MTNERKKPPGRRINPANSRHSGVPRVVRRTTLRDESRDTGNASVDEQVAALKKIPRDKIGQNELELKLAETAARLRDALAENARLSSVADSARKETERYRQLKEKAVEEIKRAVEARNESEEQRLKAGSRIEGLQDEIRVLRNELSRKTNSEKRGEYLRVQPDQLAGLIADFEQTMSGSFTGLALSNLELKLKVTIETGEERLVLLIPPVTKGNIEPDRVNELVVRVLPSGVVGIP
jgi:hypothetical protein